MRGRRGSGRRGWGGRCRGGGKGSEKGGVKDFFRNVEGGWGV